MNTDQAHHASLPEESLLSHFRQSFKRRFPETVFTCNAGVLTIPAPNPEIGRLRIFDNGHELTVDIGDITHGHFDGSTTDTDAPDIASICSEALDFLADVFSGKIEFYRLYYQGHPCGGGWRPRGSGQSAPESSITWPGN
ncbi:MAG: hypothetical protein Q4A62_09275 [Eikenella sp.]|nr:hypothetical protein [Eikenella sp.]